MAGGGLGSKFWTGRLAGVFPYTEGFALSVGWILYSGVLGVVYFYLGWGFLWSTLKTDVWSQVEVMAQVFWATSTVGYVLSVYWVLGMGEELEDVGQRVGRLQRMLSLEEEPSRGRHLFSVLLYFISSVLLIPLYGYGFYIQVVKNEIFLYYFICRLCLTGLRTLFTAFLDYLTQMNKTMSSRLRESPSNILILSQAHHELLSVYHRIERLFSFLNLSTVAQNFLVLVVVVNALVRLDFMGLEFLVVFFWFLQVFTEIFSVVYFSSAAQNEVSFFILLTSAWVEIGGKNYENHKE
jgi:hypothetical protein